MGAGEAFVRLFGLLPLRAVHGAGRGPLAAVVNAEDEIIRKRQRERARVMACCSARFVVLLFFITIAKTGMNW